MRVKSAKAKGKRLEQWICDKLLFLFAGVLTTDDIRITVGSETGSDIKLSKRARNLWPYAVEAKNRETFKTFYKYFDQAVQNAGKELEPIMFIKMNNCEPLVIMRANHYFKEYL